VKIGRGPTGIIRLPPYQNHLFAVLFFFAGTKKEKVDSLSEKFSAEFQSDDNSSAAD
jgi:hypothetical protein